MTTAQVMRLMILSGVFLIVFGFGLRATWRDAVSLFRRPTQLLRSLLAMYVVMPLFAAAFVTAVPLTPAVKVALMALVVSPVFPMLPKERSQLGLREASVYGLFVAISLLGVVVAPLSILLLVRLFGVEAHMVPVPIAGAVLVTVVAPLAAGMAVRQRAPDRAERIARSVSAVGAVFLLVGIIPVLAAAARGMISLVGNGRLLALAVFVAVGLATGHLLGGPDPDDRGALALATALRHPGIALAIARANFPDEPRAPAAILLYLIVSLIVTRPYLSWSKRRRARRTVPPPLVSPYS